MFRKVMTFTPTVWLIILGTMASRFSFFMVWPYLAVILHEQHGLSPLAIGGFISVAGVSGNLVGLYAGYLSDRFGRRRVMIAGLVLSVCSLSLLGFSHTLPLMLLGLVGESIAMSAFENPARALMTDALEDREAKDLALHLRYYLLNVGAAIGPVAGVGWGLTGQQSTFLIVAATMGAFLAASLFILYRTERHRPQVEPTAFSFREVMGVLAADRAFLMLLIAMFLLFMAYAQIDAGLVQYLQLSGRQDVTRFYPIITMINGLTIVVFQFPLLALTRNMTPILRAIMGVALMATAFAMLAVVPVQSDLPIYIAALVLSLGEVILFPTLNIIVDRMAREDLKGSYFGASSLSGFGWAIAPLVGGALLSWGGGLALWWTMVGITLFAIWFFSRVGGKTERAATV